MRTGNSRSGSRSSTRENARSSTRCSPRSSAPPSRYRGLSGAIRRYAYCYSEGRLAHWLLLVLGDRVNAWKHHLTSLLSLYPDNPITETGVKAEFTHHGLRSRARQHRADLKHHWLDPVIVGGPWLVAAGAAYVGARAVVRSLSHTTSDAARTT